MGKKGRIAFIIVLVLCLAGLGWIITRPREPVYKGRSLTSWLSQYQTNRWPLDKEAETAIRAIGPKATPFLLEKLSSHESQWRINWTLRLSKTWRERLHVPSLAEYRKAVDERRRQGAYGFSALKELATPAVPQMLVLLDDHPDHRVRYLTVFALRTMGPAAKDALPRLIECLNDPLFEIKDDAVMAMGTIGQQPDVVVPKILVFIEKNKLDVTLCRDAMDSLGKFGPDAKAAISTLQDYSRHPDPSLSVAASNALQKIDPSALLHKQAETK